MNCCIILFVLCIVISSTDKIRARNLNVVDFGAVGDGITDDSKGFMEAWESACGSTGFVSLVVPAKKTFLLKSVKFIGPCNCSTIQFLIQGNIVAPSKMADWSASYMGSWIVFAWISGLDVVGDGQIDGQGYDWWNCALTYGYCSRPMGLKFHNCKSLQVAGLRVINTPTRFLSVSDCENASISSLTIINPEGSPNTDGMDISHSTNIQIRNCHISTGDDCIAILSGCSNIHIDGVSCIKGHGISIGSLGHNGDYDTVEEVHVKNCNFGATLNGARIKTWQGGSGFARRVSFENITLSNTSNPIIIDQYYCLQRQCHPQEASVNITDVTFTGFKGSSYTEIAVKIGCSQSVGCSNIEVSDINITPSGPLSRVSSKCINAHGRSFSAVPSVQCLSS